MGKSEQTEDQCTPARPTFGDGRDKKTTGDGGPGRKTDERTLTASHPRVLLLINAPLYSDSGLTACQDPHPRVADCPQIELLRLPCVKALSVLPGLIAKIPL